MIALLLMAAVGWADDSCPVAGCSGAAVWRGLYIIRWLPCWPPPYLSFENLVYTVRAHRVVVLYTGIEVGRNVKGSIR